MDAQAKKLMKMGFEKEAAEKLAAAGLGLPKDIRKASKADLDKLIGKEQADFSVARIAR